MDKKQIILFDIDHTLFNGKIYREKFFSAIAQKVNHKDFVSFNAIAEEIYWELRRSGPFFPDLFSQKIIDKLSLKISVRELEKVIWDKNIFRASLFQEAEEVLQELSQDKNLIIGIFSAGPDAFQRAKIHAIKNFFHSEHIHIFLIKEEGVAVITKKYKNLPVFVIDDLLNVLAKVKSQNPSMITIWSKRGTWVNRQKEQEEIYKPDYTVSNLHEVVAIIKENKK